LDFSQVRDDFSGTSPAFEPDTTLEQWPPHYAAVFESEDRAEWRPPLIALIGIEKRRFNHYYVANCVGPLELSHRAPKPAS
jgi:hypothetical protein